MPLRLDAPMPALEGATEWINDGQAAEALAGHPVLVYFWSVGCHICHENMAKLAQWRDAFGPRGLRMVAIHAPRNPEEMDVARVREAVREFGITDPCAIDNRYALMDAFDNKFFPAYFLFDATHHLRSRTAGDAGLGLLADVLVRVVETRS